jgi:deoxyribodipyrimidine photolyase-like uncharacterized protein
MTPAETLAAEAGRLLTVKNLAIKFGVTPTSVRRWIADKQIPDHAIVRTPGGRALVRETWADAALRRGQI